MQIKIKIEVKDQSEAEAIKLALADPVIRAAVVVSGYLIPCSPAQRLRILNWVVSKLQEDRDRANLT